MPKDEPKEEKEAEKAEKPEAKEKKEAKPAPKAEAAPQRRIETKPRDVFSSGRTEKTVYTHNRKSGQR